MNRLYGEPALLFGFLKVHVAATELLRHHIEIQSKILATEEMQKLYRLPIGQLGTTLQVLLIIVIFILNLLLSRGLDNVSFGLLQELPDPLELHILGPATLLAVLMQDLLDLLLLLNLHLFELCLSLLKLTLLFDLDSEEALFE